MIVIIPRLQCAISATGIGTWKVDLGVEGVGDGLVDDEQRSARVGDGGGAAEVVGESAVDGVEGGEEFPVAVAGEVWERGQGVGVGGGGHGAEGEEGAVVFAHVDGEDGRGEGRDEVVEDCELLDWVDCKSVSVLLCCCERCVSGSEREDVYWLAGGRMRGVKAGIRLTIIDVAEAQSHYATNSSIIDEILCYGCSHFDSLLRHSGSSDHDLVQTDNTRCSATITILNAEVVTGQISECRRLC